MPPIDKPGVDKFVRTIAAETERSQQIQTSSSTDRAESRPWWKTLFTTPAMGRLALALGCILIMVSGSIYLTRSSAPVLNTTLDSGRDVMRSNTVHLISPKGDLAEKPSMLQ